MGKPTRALIMFLHLRLIIGQFILILKLKIQNWNCRAYTLVYCGLVRQRQHNIWVQRPLNFYLLLIFFIKKVTSSESNAKRLKNPKHNAPMRQYLDQTVVPALLVGMKELVKER